MSRSFRDLPFGPGTEPTTATIVVALLAGVVIVAGLFVLESFVRPLLGDLPIGFLLVIVGFGGLSAFLVSYDERLWLVTALLSSIGFLFVGEESEGLPPTELLFHVYGTFGSFLWFVKEFIIRRRSIIVSSFDFLFATALGLCLIVSGISFTLHHGDTTFFIKELLSFSSLFFYFPLRKVMRNDRHVALILGIFLLITLLNGAVNLVNYQERVVQTALMFGEVNARAAANESYSALMTCLGAAIVMYGEKRLWKWFGLGVLTLGAGFLVITLSRGPVIAAGAGIVISLLFTSATRATRLLMYGVVGIAINIGLVYLIFPGFADSIFSNIGTRFETLERISSDKSLSSRFDEYNVLIEEYIPASPLIGHGFGVFYTYYNKPFGYTFNSLYTHNGYLHALFKFGLPVGLFFLVVLMMPLLRAPYMSYTRMPTVRRLYFVFAVAAAITLLIVNFTSNTLYSTSTLLLWGIVLALFDYLNGIDREDVLARFVTSARTVRLVEPDES